MVYDSFLKRNFLVFCMNGLLIGRFQPFHLGHLEALRFALTKVEKLWVGIGSSNKEHEANNPFSADERKEMILTSIDESISDKIEICYVPDLDDHQKWVDSIDSIVPRFEVVFTNDEFTQTLYREKGVKVFPVPFKDRDVLSGTNIRKKIQTDQDWYQLVPDGTKNVLEKIGANQRLKRL